MERKVFHNGLSKHLLCSARVFLSQDGASTLYNQYFLCSNPSISRCASCCTCPFPFVITTSSIFALHVLSVCLHILPNQESTSHRSPHPQLPSLSHSIALMCHMVVWYYRCALSGCPREVHSSEMEFCYGYTERRRCRHVSKSYRYSDKDCPSCEARYYQRGR